MSSIGERVKQLREARGIRVVELAKAVGIKQPSLWQIENGVTKTLRGNTLTRLCEELHTTADFLLHGSTGVVGIELAQMEAELTFTIRTLSSARRLALIDYARFLMAQQPGQAPRNGTQTGAVSQIQTARKRPPSQV